jgi:hypothetical protein
MWDSPDDKTATLGAPPWDTDAYLDLDGDGTLELIMRSRLHDGRDLKEGEESPADRAVFSSYRLTGGYYQLWKDLAFYAGFVPQPRDSALSTATLEGPTFHGASSTGRYMMRLVRSALDGTWVIKSAEVRLNGVLLADDGVFRQGARVITIPVALQAANCLTVMNIVVDGRPSTKSSADDATPALTLTIEPQ